MSEAIWGKIYLLPSRVSLEKDIQRIRQVLDQFVFEYEELVYKDCVQLAREFYLKLGEDFLELLHRQYAVTFVKRKITYLQQDSFPSEADLDAKVSLEIQHHLALIQKIEKEVAAAQQIYEEELSLEDSRRLRQLFREIVMQTHASLHPFQTNNQKLLYEKALAFYRKNNLAMMELVSENLNEEYFTLPDYSLNQLVAMRQALRKSVKEVQYALLKKRAAFPYNIRYHFLVDEHCEDLRSMMRKRSQQLQADLQIYQGLIDTFHQES